MARERTGIDNGHEVTIGVTIVERLVSVPACNFPFLIDASPKAKPSDRLDLVRHVTRVDGEVGSLATVGQDFVTRWKRVRPVPGDEQR
ncbi:hypothetical protein D3227_37600 [Mesorhizobium waimense]|uniref:Uncharacterized protein n=1 Tax=Mesorhizobium waimense TaxID=1300307 RepID=A0A3A5K601_9HYPH|nr:hypothetical protein [Mesorhizobium waimense]RJT26022.1 hypothetical protein D3227_37600 [Mesorhizobium waimense]